jgi:PAS domain S-box-containing protein
MAGIGILLVGRDPSSLEVIRKMLKFHNQAYEVDFATDAASCLERVRSGRYDLVLLDNDLPDRPGLDLLTEIHKQSPDLPVILMVEDGQDDLAIAAMERGALDYVMKVRGYLTALPFTVLKALEVKKRETAARPREASPKKEPSSGMEGVFVLDRKGRFLSADTVTQRILEYQENELLELCLTDLIGRGSEAELQQYLARMGTEAGSVRIPMIAKSGASRQVELRLCPIRDDAGAVAGYRGKLRDVSAETGGAMLELRIDQQRLFRELAKAAEEAADRPVQALLQRLAEVAARQFRFQRVTVALLDQRRHVYVKQALVGFEPQELATKAMEVPKQLVDRIFQERFRIKVIYSDQEFLDHPRLLPGGVPERRTQVRRPGNQWDPRDLILVALTDLEGRTFGFVTLEQPADNLVPTRDAFHNLELFGVMASGLVEQALRSDLLQRRYRRLKQFLAGSSLHRLDQPFAAALNDTAWLLRFLSDFDLVMIGIISRQSERLEFRAAACQDRLRADHLRGIHWSLSDLRSLLKVQYRVDKSYLVSQQEEPIREVKARYYGLDWTERFRGEWGPWHALLVPVRTRQGRIVGILLFDDPSSAKLPSRESVHLLQLMAGQIGLAIENRVYLVESVGVQKRVPPPTPKKASAADAVGLRKLIDRFLH